MPNLPNFFNRSHSGDQKPESPRSPRPAIDPGADELPPLDGPNGALLLQLQRQRGFYRAQAPVVAVQVQQPRAEGEMQQQGQVGQRRKLPAEFAEGYQEPALKRQRR